MATKTRQYSDFLIGGGQSDLDLPGKPHIQPGVLHPAIEGKDVDGVAISTSHGSTYTYGTTHADGRMYYYTDIKGSKPIKDPRIGAHFGSQRYKARTIQLLEQETATHGTKVYSVDGREWMRISGSANGTGNVSVNNSTGGNYIYLNNTTIYVEITGYFNNINVSHATEPNRNWRYSLDGATEVTTDYGATPANSPLGARYVDSGSFFNIPITPALGIHTIKLRTTLADMTFNGIELIAQDTSSTANRSKIQIPAQNVVSYGKKFSLSATAQHYNPFDGMSGAKTLAQLGDYIDTATSLGMENWKGGTSNYYKPFNGGRVVKWVDSSGTIKTSVTMMPPNAQNLAGTASNAVSDAHIQAGTNDDLINFDTTTIANATPLHEVAKMFHWREFGNGAANGGTMDTWADISMLHTTADDIAYVMDDGLTSFHADDGRTWSDTNGGLTVGGNKCVYFTFIGTGLTLSQVPNTSNTYGIDNGTYAQNLSYGTHIFKYKRVDGSADLIYIDGVQVYGDTSTDGWLGSKWWSVHQPKKPPIPDDACIISDYMLMADTVQIPNTTAALDGHISKGMLRKSITRDFWIKPDSGTNVATLSVSMGLDSGFLLQNSTGQVLSVDLPHFGTKFMVHGESAGTGHWASSYGGTAVSQTQIDNTSTTNAMDKFSGPSTAKELGINKLELSINAGYGMRLVDMNTPIHTSSHYQSFETHLLHELVGGDRNMEQTNLVVTSDGKSWDEVTRDTSYIGNHAMRVTTDTNYTGTSVVIFDEYRGNYNGRDYFTKDFCPAYDRHICLRNGWYQMSMFCYEDAAEHLRIYVNNAYVATSYSTGSDQSNLAMSYSHYFQRGDYFYVKGAYGNDGFAYANFEIIRID